MGLKMGMFRESLNLSELEVPILPTTTTIWLVVWNMAFIFPYIGNSHHPNWLIFFRGVETTNQTTIVSNAMEDPLVTDHHDTGEKPCGTPWGAALIRVSPDCPRESTWRDLYKEESLPTRRWNFSFTFDLDHILDHILVLKAMFFWDPSTFFKRPPCFFPPSLCHFRQKNEPWRCSWSNRKATRGG